jgi:hypothetical protein
MSRGSAPRKLLSTENLKRFGYQVLSSAGVGWLRSALRSVMPSVIDSISDCYLNPFLVGGCYTILARVISGSSSYMYNFMVSMSAEMVAGLVEVPVRSLIPGYSAPTRSITAAAQSARTNVLG